MEVHQHTHSSGKKWTHYLWEFLMLFLAVTLGFFVENLREHNSEHKRERQYIESMLDDLKLDTAQIHFVVGLRRLREGALDSLIHLMKSPDRDKYGNEIYYCARVASRALGFIYNDRTMQQLKNGGNLRLIRNKQVSDSIMIYDSKVRTIQGLENIESGVIDEYRKLVGDIFDASVFHTMVNGALVSRPTGNPKLFSENPVEINRLCVRVHYMHTASTTNSQREQALEKAALGLMQFLRKEYHLE